MKKIVKFLFFFILSFSTLLNPAKVLADVAPPIQPPITNLDPGTQITNVRMMEETVVIEVQPDTIKDSLGKAHITASFTMRNLGNSTESLAVRYPISASNGFFEYPEISNLIVKVNKVQIPFSRVNYPDIRYGRTDVPWAEFQITFPVDQDVNIEISYFLNGSGYPPFVAYYYLLETGAGWAGTIGSADIILRLPYPASTLNVITDLQIGWSETSTGGEFNGNEVRWHFSDFEPGAEGPVQNMEFSLVAPEAWQAVLKARSDVDLHPEDGEAWGRLAMAYKRIFFLGKGYRTDAGGEELYSLSVEAYEKCLSLKPTDAQWHAGFAELLSNRAYWDSWSSGPTQDAIRAIQEIHTSLQLAPTDPIVLSIAENISYMFPGGLVYNNNIYDFPWLTQTPTPHPATATTIPSFDPVSVSGEYKSDLLTLTDQKKMQMVVKLETDHSARFEGKFEDDQSIIASGYWMDNGDGSIRILVKDTNNQSININFLVEASDLKAIEIPSTFSGPVWLLNRTILETPTPPPSETYALTGVPFQTPTIETKPASNPICGSSLFAPIGLIFTAVISLKLSKKRGMDP
jgi:hypothetical protein